MITILKRFTVALPASSRVIIILAASGWLTCGCRPKQVVANIPPQNEVICCFGDSLVAGYGASKDEAYPARLEVLTGQTVINMGSSGDTTKDGVARLKAFKPGEYGVIIVTLGGNDLLRRVDWEVTEQNLRQIFETLQGTGAAVVFTGVTMPLTSGRGKRYEALCKEMEVLYIPDLLDGILFNDDLKSDEIHPNAKGYQRIAERVAEILREENLLSPQAGSES